MELRCPYHGSKYIVYDGTQEFSEIDRRIKVYRCDVCGYRVWQAEFPHDEGLL